jgi:hypothetical protein
MATVASAAGAVVQQRSFISAAHRFGAGGIRRVAPFTAHRVAAQPPSALSLACPHALSASHHRPVQQCHGQERISVNAAQQMLMKHFSTKAKEPTATTEVKSATAAASSNAPSAPAPQTNAAETARNMLASGESSASNTPSNMAVLKQLLRYLWPAGEPALRARVVISLALLMGAKVCSVYVPIMFKHAVDMLSITPDATNIAVTLPLAALIGCQLAQGTLRSASLNTFRCALLTIAACLF